MLMTGALVLAIAGPLAVLSTVLTAQGLFSAEKSSLRGVSISILHRLQQDGVTPQDDALTQSTIQELEKGLDFASQNGEMQCAILGENRRVLWQSQGFSIPLNDRFFREPNRSKLFLAKITSEEDATVDGLWSVWNLLYRRRRNGFTVFASDVQEYEVFERNVVGLIVAFVVTIVLALVATTIHARRVVGPLDHISTIMQCVRGGDLAARIDTSKLHHEIGDLGTAVNQTLDELQMSFGRISQFSADAAHELRTPLAGICGTLEVTLARPRSTEEYEDTISSCLEQVSHLSGITEQLLLLTKPGVPDQMVLLPTRLDESVAEQIDCLEFLADKQNVRFSLHFDEELQVLSDPALLGRMIRNLIDNAVKASPPGETVEIDMRRDGDFAVLRVRDHGHGIDPQFHNKIFERFCQMDDSRSQGLGLGLSMVRWIVECHSGTVTVESDLGQGACFIVRLPIMPPAQPGRRSEFGDSG